MANINEHYLKLQAGYLFPEIARRVDAFINSHPQADVIRLGIGDVVKGIPRPIVNAMKKAVEEMAHDKTLQGYPPDKGQKFLREAIAKHDFVERGVHVDSEQLIDEIFVSDGAKCDSANLQEIFATDCVVALTDPIYPVYCDTNVMAGRTGEADDKGMYEKLVYMPCSAETGFVPDLPKKHVDLIYLCSPNNPTGAVMNHTALKRWVDYARKERAVIFFDASYEAYITDKNLPHSIYEVEGAREVAIETRSFSKSAGFTGIRCGYTVVPKELMGYAASNKKVSLHELWARRHATKFNGVAYPVQRGAEAAYSKEGQEGIKELIKFYSRNAEIMRDRLKEAGLTVYGGENSPFLWLETPDGQDSWKFFDYLLDEAHIVGTPGVGFGSAGEGYLRLMAFNHRDKIEEAMDRISNLDLEGLRDGSKSKAPTPVAVKDQFKKAS